LPLALLPPLPPFALCGLAVVPDVSVLLLLADVGPPVAAPAVATPVLCVPPLPLPAVLIPPVVAPLAAAPPAFV
jgi:hypothetical protein